MSETLTKNPMDETTHGEVEHQGARKPIWERIRERMASVPAEELAKLPTDGAEQHDHYLYGLPKRKVK